MLRRLPPATSALVLACVGYTGLAALAGWSASQAGAVRARELWEGEYWRLVTATFLHHTGFWAHLVLNAASLFFVGRVLERACGRAVFLSCVAGSALAGFAASLAWTDGADAWRMGISGAVAGLIGLLLAIEWAITPTWKEFVKQRNTLLILFFLGLSVPLALWIESRYPHVKVDHAAHAGGFAYGLLGGLAYYSRRGRRPLRGVAVALLLAVVPVWVAAHPAWDPVYLFFRGHRAFAAGDTAAAVDYYERGLDRLPAGYRPDPGHVAGIQRAFLRLAAALPPESAERAQALVERAAGFRPPVPEAWFEYAEACAEAGRRGQAYVAFQTAAEAYRLTGRPSEEWPARQRALRIMLGSDLAAQGGPPAERLAVALKVLQTARGAIGGLASEDPAAAEKLLADAAGWAAGVAHSLPEGVEGSEALVQGLEHLYRALAENTPSDARRPTYRYRSAYWYARLHEGAADPEVESWVRARFAAALAEARAVGDAATQAAVADWFAARGLPLPEPDLDGPGDGG